MSGRLLYIFNPHSDLAFADPTVTEEKADEPKLTWKVVLRTGTWKLRPGPGGTKLDEPLKVFRDKAPKGHISMSELVKSFKGDDKGPAKEHVTFPQVHADGTVSDGGFVRKLVIQDVAGEDGSKTKQSLLWAGIDVTDSDLKKKVDEKSIVGCSGGILFDYARTEDGKVFPQILSHVMATNSPWINGCGGYDDKLPEGVMAAEDVKLEADEILLEDEVADPTPEDAPPSKPESGAVIWKPEEGFQYMRNKVQKALESWRREVLASLPRDVYAYDDFPYMSCEDVSYSADDGKALIKSGYGDDADRWVAVFKREDGDVVIEPFQTWTEAKSEWVAASEAAPPRSAPRPDRPAQVVVRPLPTMTTGLSLSEAQRVRDAARRPEGPVKTNTTGGRPSMGRISDLLHGVELSDEQRAAIQAEEAEIERKDKQLEKDRDAFKKGAIDSFLSEMDGWGLGDKDTPGLRVEVRNIFMSDDGGTALNLSEITESGNRTQPVEMTATDIVKRVIGALPRNQEGKINFSTQARALPGDGKPDEGRERPGGNGDEDKRSPKERSDAMLAELGVELNYVAPSGGGR